MADESDGITEAFEGQLRVAVTAAGRVGEVIARQREESARRSQAQSQHQAREMASRFKAERQTARAELIGVYRNDWWERATPEQIGTTLATARAWGNEDPEAVRAEVRMRDELRTRYGVDVDQAGNNAHAVQAAVDAELLRGQFKTKRGRGTDEDAEAALLVRGADWADRQAGAAYQREGNALEGDDERAQAREKATSHARTAEAARTGSGTVYDSAARRVHDANQLETKGIEHEAVAAKMYADVGNAKPATEAVRGAPTIVAKARSTRSVAARVQRFELGR